jgi:protein-disulfide isomerase
MWTLRPSLTILAASLSLAVVACKSGQDGQKGSGSESPVPSDSKPAPAAGSGEYRIDPNTVILTWSGGQMTYGELYKKHEGEFTKLKRKYDSDVYAAEQQNLEGWIVQQLIEGKAKAAGKSAEEYVQGIAGEPEVTEADISKFYDENVKQSGQPMEMVKDRIKGYLAGQKKQEKVRAEFDRLKAEAKVKISLPEPAGASFDLAGRPMIGNPNAKVTIVEFSDFECPYCSQAAPKVHEIVKAYPNDVKVYFLHYPLSFHKTAHPAAVAAACAQKQEKFWEMHDKLFTNQQGLTEDFFKSSAKELGLDESKFVACLGDASVKAMVDKDLEQGTAAGVEGTPSFFINGVPYARGVPTVETIKEYVQRAN